VGIIKDSSARLFVAVAAAMLPWPLKRRLLSWLLGYRLHPLARIGVSVVEADHAELESGASVGHLTYARRLDRLTMAESSRLGNLNYITGGRGRGLRREATDGEALAGLELGEGAALTNRHYIDCSDRITIGKFSTVAGVRSQMFTHSVDLAASEQKCGPVAIGAYCFLGTGVIVLPNTRLPDFSVLGAGSLLRTKFDRGYMLYSGVPATAVKELSRDWKYFSRSKAYVDWAREET
jgi:acetyltransferase-like isoleucine patch superfamily enzyme